MDEEAADFLKQAVEEISSQIEQDESIKSDLSGEDVSILHTLAHSLYEIGDYKQAKAIFQQLILSHPMEQKFWLGLASALQMEKNYSRALTAWGMAALINDADPLPHFHAAECLLSMGDKNEAMKALKSAKERLSKNHSHLEQKISAFEISWQQITIREENT